MGSVDTLVCAARNHRAVRFARAFVQCRGDDILDALLIRLRLPAVVRGAEVLKL